MPVFILAITIIGALIYLQHDYQQFKHRPLNIEQEQMFTVASGSSFDDINADFTAQNIVLNPIYMKLLAIESGYATMMKSGEYQLKPGMTPIQLLELLVSGKVAQYALTLVEGWNITDVQTFIQNNQVLVKTLDYSQPLILQLYVTEPALEGLLFPDTYHFPRGATDKAFLQRAYDRLQMVLQEEWGQREENLPYHTPYEALVMASIIEKETSLTSERSAIAGVFVRRLRKGMKLQTDPTVIYAMGKQFDGNIREKDLNIDSPYNTYRYRGLPPTPIALAGREAIHAALHPEPGKDLYFVSMGNGAHYFSETLDEHNRAVAKYQLKKNQ